MHQLINQYTIAKSKGRQHLIKFRKNLYHNHMKSPNNHKAHLIMEIEKELASWTSA